MKKELTESELNDWNDGKQFIKRNPQFGDWRKFTEQELIDIARNVFKGMTKT